MMNDLIKRSDALNLLKDALYGKSYKQACNKLMDIPEGVVRCRNCSNTDRPDAYTIWCTGRGSPMLLVPPDGFCDKGRRDDGKT